MSLARIRRKLEARSQRRAEAALDKALKPLRDRGLTEEQIAEILGWGQARRADREMTREQYTRRVVEDHKRSFAEIIEAARTLGETDEQITVRLEEIVKGFRTAAATTLPRDQVDRFVGELRADYRQRLSSGAASRLGG